MESSQQPAAAPPPAAPKKDNKMMIIAGVVVVVIIVAIIAILMMGGSDDDGGNGGGGGTDSTIWHPAVGDSYTYSMSMSGTSMGTVVYRVVSVTSTEMTLNTTTEYMGYQSYNEQTVPIGQSSDYTDWVTNPPSGYSIADKGTQTMSTEWGSVVTHHYQVTYSSEGTDVTADLWLYKGFLVKMSGSSGGYDVVMELTETNITFS